ncbi:hypothetical protein GCM10010517_19410 [Streptosporangium fragile]|uniref:Uncharacterized protein n=1 Tax=Streptosporangium fragile TaxID=46186 RepID=A0ABP6IA17_9ACTN
MIVALTALSHKAQKLRPSTSEAGTFHNGPAEPARPSARAPASAAGGGSRTEPGASAPPAAYPAGNGRAAARPGAREPGPGRGGASR